jgi:TonB-linked SusC/RagA family outer membrane protein
MHLTACRSPFLNKIRVGRKQLLVMNFLSIFLLVAGLNVTAGVYSQKVTLSAENLSLKQVFREIKKQTGFTFAYREGLLQKAGKVSLRVSNANIQQVLDICFRNQPLTYTIVSDDIVVIKEKTAPAPEPVKTEIAPPIKITGKITSEDGTPLANANVQEKGKTYGTMTKADGSFELSVESTNSVLVISYVGFVSKEITVGNQTDITIKLAQVQASMNDIVIIGYGAQKKSDLTGSVTSVKGADVTKIGGSNAAEALQGKAPGVSILNQGGPGAAPLVFVRGLGTNGDASPLYVVDGMMVSGIAYLSPADIASIEILKDASATAIYGSRGANGVILVTTKKGRSGKAVFNFSASQGFQYLTRKYDVANGRQYAELVNLFNTNAGKAPVYNNLDSISALGEGTDWTKEVIQKGIVKDYQLGVSGGSENTHYSLSASYHKEDGVIKFSSFDRLTLRANVDYKLNKRLTIGHNLAMASSRYLGNSQWNGGRGLNSIYRISPLLAVRKSNGEFTPGQDPDVINPFAAFYLNKDVKSKPLQFVGNAYLDFQILDGLSFRSSYGTDFTLNRIDAYIPAFNISSPNQIQASNSIQNGYETRYTWLWENTLTYDKSIGNDHHVNLLAGYTSQNYDYNTIDLTGSGLLSTDQDYRYINALPVTSLSWTNSANLPSSESILSYLFRANYTYKDRYLLTASFRADGSSKFANGKRWGHFPSVAAGWRVSEEEFLKDIKWINNLKLRGSWGQIGNNKIANYQTFNTLTQDMVYAGVFNQVFYNSATITAASNPDITWEVAEQTDLGFEFATMSNRLKFELDYYNRETKNLLLQLPIPGGSTGISTPAYTNAGTVRNRGYEFAVSWDDRVGDLSYGIRLTGSANKNRIVDFRNQTVYNGDWMVPSTHISTAGLPIGTFYGYKVAGIAQSQAEIDQLNENAAKVSGVAGKQYWSGLKPGDLIFQDINGDGFIDVKDKTDIGSPHAKFIGGATLTASYKGFDAAIDLMVSYGSKIYNATRNQFLASGLSNMHVEWLNSWTPTNTNTDIPRYAVNTSTSQQSDFNIADGTYFKARFMELGYTLNKNVSAKAGISKLRVYVNATNPFYITKYKGFSPEVSNSYGVSTMGDDFRTYPVSGTIRAGVNVMF